MIDLTVILLNNVYTSIKKMLNNNLNIKRFWLRNFRYYDLVLSLFLLYTVLASIQLAARNLQHPFMESSLGFLAQNLTYSNTK